jgi:glycosyltransferase involved in cell wall biosynthesis
MPPSRRALILVEDLPVPFDRRVWAEAKALRDAGWSVTVISPKGVGATAWSESIDGISVRRYPLPTTAAGLVPHLLEYAVAIPMTAVFAMLTRLRGRIDVVHACNPPDLFFPIAWLLKLLGATFIYDQHDLAPEVYLAQGGRKGGMVHRALLWSEARTYRLADVVIATNETYRGFAIERGGVDPERVVVVRSSPDPERIHRVAPDPALKRGRRYLVAYLGTMGPQDGVDLFLEAAARLIDSGRRDIGFVAIGGGNQLEHLRSEAHRRGYDEDVHFVGRIPDEEVRQYLSTADIGISPDPANGFNEFCTMNKTLEYMASGLPVIAFDLEETRVSAGDAGAYVTPNDVEGMALAIADLLADAPRKERMSTDGMQRMRGPLSWAVSVENLLRAYAAAVSHRERSSERRAGDQSPPPPDPAARRSDLATTITTRSHRQGR